MKKIVAISFALCLTLSAVVNAQETNKTLDSCLNKTNLHNCTVIATFSIENRDLNTAKKLLQFACPANKKEPYDADACGIIGLEHLPNESGNNLGLYQPDMKKAENYLMYACKGESSHKDKYCSVLGVVKGTNEKAKHKKK